MGWSVKRISNPAYKGVWEQKNIANPDFKDDDNLYSFADFGFLGFDLWQVKGGTIFDNIILTDDTAEADVFAKKWKELSEFENSKKEEEVKKSVKKNDGKEAGDHAKEEV